MPCVKYWQTFLNELLSLILGNDGKVPPVPRDAVARQVAGFLNPARIRYCNAGNMRNVLITANVILSLL
jgi:hypothetical protein